MTFALCVLFSLDRRDMPKVSNQVVLIRRVGGACYRGDLEILGVFVQRRHGEIVRRNLILCASITYSKKRKMC